MNEHKTGILYICATPIGNLEDITLRVLRVLKEVNLIAAEDTRRTLKLLNHYGIKTALTGYHEHNRAEKGLILIERLLAGQDIALVSDSGMPGISDPGRELVQLCQNAGVAVSMCPGASAGISALVLSGLDNRRYCFEGFLPRQKKRRRQILEQLAVERRTIVLYEAPHRISETLKSLFEHLGDREAAIVREITKIHEETRRGGLASLLEYYSENQARGEFVIVMEGARIAEEDWPEDLLAHVEQYIKQGLTEMAAVKLVARDRGLAKSAVYRALLTAKPVKTG